MNATPPTATSPTVADRAGAHPVVVADGLTKRFGAFTALDRLDLEIAPGEVHGFLGPNGAGKSTTIRVILGLHRATAGRVELFGEDPWTNAARLHGRLAYVPGDVDLWPGLTGGQCIDILIGAQGPTSTRRRDDLIERFDLDPTKRARDYSKGNRQKVALVAGLAAEAELLVLDEPTSGLDPLMERIFQEVIRERRAEGTTVLLSSHILGEVEVLADRISIIRKGRRVRTGTLDDLRADTRTMVHAHTASRPDGLASIPGMTRLSIEPLETTASVRFSIDQDHLDEAIGVVHRAGLKTLTVQPPSLDDLFLDSYRDDTGAGRASVASGGAS
jgi:ABC-2 type transport system ATP-binding protein